MSKGVHSEGISLIEITKIPLTASIRKASDITGLSYQAIRKAINDKKVVAIPTEGEKVMVSMWSLLETYNLVPVEVLERIWMKE